jgi:serine/threonine protein kinase/Tol biopolymer transport system component
LDPDRWRRINELYHDALARPDAERKGFLTRACTDDPSLQAEIQTLLDQSPRTDDFLNVLGQPQLTALSDHNNVTRRSLRIGQHLGVYVVESLLAAGGMGEVYRARDTKLGRDVAIKLLPSALTNDPSRRMRLEREAHVLASLNHPNIAAIYGIEESDGAALVMELVEGPTLSDRIARGPIPLNDTTAIARQIADALEAAHEHGVAHRDLKPDNIKVRPDGIVKVLDFGLAKQSISSAEHEVTRSVEPQATAVGAIIGTPAYMAPEQATGQASDRRADIWAFGVVLYEMVTGSRLFDGATTSEILSKVISHSPNLGALPPTVRAVVEKCLRKDPHKRWQWIGDVRLALEEHSEDKEALDRPATHGSSRLLLGVIAIVCAIGFAAVSALFFIQAEPDSPTTRFQVPIPGDADDAHFELSPNGRALAIAAAEGGERRLWVRRLDDIEARSLPGTEGAEMPFWSPDNTEIGFFADRRLKRVPIAGGTPVIAAEIGAGFIGASWNDDGVIVFSSNGGLKRVNSSGGAITPLNFDGLLFAGIPRFLPDGRHVFFRGNRLNEEESGVLVGSLDSSRAQHVLADFSNAAYASSREGRPSGYVLFRRAESLMAQRFDMRELRVEGDAFTVADQIAGVTGYAEFSLSSVGHLAYRSAAQFQLMWVGRAGATLEKVGPPSTDWAPGRAIRLSPDHTKIAYSKVQAEGGMENRDVWQMDLQRHVPERLTSAPSPDLVPVWSPDGKQIVFASSRDATTGFDPYLLSQGGDERVLAEIPGNGGPLDWSSDGRFVLVLQDRRIWFIPTDGGDPKLYLQLRVEDARLDPDGRWVAYVSNESGQNDVYVRSFPTPGRPVRVSAAGGIEPQWRQDGRELFYVTPDGALVAVPVTSSASGIQLGSPTRLFPSAAGYQVSSDGQRFLIARPADVTGRTINVVLNWQASLDR